MNSTVTPVESFRFLGSTISRIWSGTIIVKKAQQRLYFLRQLRKFNLPQELLKKFYSAIIESILCTSITVWFSSATKSDQKTTEVSLDCWANHCTTLPTLQNCTHPEWENGLENHSGPSHPAHSLFERLTSGRRYDLWAPEQFLSPSNPSHEHLTLNMEHTTL